MLALALLLLTAVDDEPGPAGLRLGLAVGGGVAAGDAVAGVDVTAGVDAALFSFFVRAPLMLRLVDAPPRVDPTAPAFCAHLRCEELLAGDDLDATALARVVDEIRLFQPADPFTARAGRLLASLGTGAVLDRFTTASSWDRRTSGARATLRLPWHDLSIDAVVGNVLAPGELVAARVDAAVDDPSAGERAGWLRPVHVAVDAGADLFAPAGAVDRTGALPATTPVRPLTATNLELRVDLGDDAVTVAPWLGAGVVTGLSVDGGDEATIGGGGTVGVRGNVRLGVVDVRARAAASWGTAGFRRAPFSTLYLVERRRALLGATTRPGDDAPGGLLRVPAPAGGGVDVRVEASLFDIAAPLVRLHTGPAPGENVVEAGVVVDVDPVRVAVTALRRGFVTPADVVAPNLAAFPVVGTLEAGVRVLGPLSLGVRWLRLPRFRGDGPLRVDDDVQATLSVNGLLALPR